MKMCRSWYQTLTLILILMATWWMTVRRMLNWPRSGKLQCSRFKDPFKWEEFKLDVEEHLCPESVWVEVSMKLLPVVLECCLHCCDNYGKWWPLGLPKSIFCDGGLGASCVSFGFTILRLLHDDCLYSSPCVLDMKLAMINGPPNGPVMTSLT